VPEAPVAEGRLGKRDFAIDTSARTVTCPAGHIARIGTARSGERGAIFGRGVCGARPLRVRCLGTKTAHKKVILAPTRSC